MAVAAPWYAQAQPRSLLSFKTQRLIHRFDFEEAKFNNFEQMPMYWYAIGRTAITTDRNFMRQPLHQQLINRTDFPGYTQVRFDHPQQEPGNHRLYLGLNGGNVGAFLEVGAVPAVPQSDYLITATVRTTSLRHARARLVAYFVDDTGQRIEASVSASDLVQTDGHKQTVSVKLYGDFIKAAWIGLQVELLQPRSQPDVAAQQHKVFYEEVQGGAWFDDIRIWQMPHITVNTQNPVNTVRSPSRPRLNMRVRDMTARPLIVDVTLYDHLMRQAAASQRPINQWTPMNWKWDPPLDRFGWYLVDMVVYEPPKQPSGRPTQIARTVSSLLWLPNEPVMDPQDTARFRIVGEQLPPQEMDLLPALMDQARLSSLVVSAWQQDTTPRNIDGQQRRLGDVIQPVLGKGQHLVMSLSPVPQELAQSHNIEPDDPIRMFRKPQAVWQPYTTPMLIRHGQRVRQWQVGTARRPRAFFYPDLGGLVGSIRREFQNMAPQPQVVLPWRLDQSRRFDAGPDSVFMIDVPVAVRPKYFKHYTPAWHQSPPARFWLHLREPPATQLAHTKRAEDLALRMIYGWEANPRGLAVTKPWTRSAGRRVALLPDPLLGVFTSVAHRLAGRRVVGHLPLSKGLHAMIFDGPAGGMLAAWNESAPPQHATIDLFLGDQPHAVDLWGNRSPVPLDGRRHRLALSTTPVFIEGIDPQLALFRASFKIDPPFIESTLTKHERVIRFSNPWPYTISGHLRITDPEGWEILPSRHHFSVASGQTATIPVEVNFPVTESAGPKRLVAHFDFVSKQRYTVDVSTPMELGLTNVGFDATLTLETNPETGTQDAVVTEMITNKSDDTIALYCFAHLFGYPRQERIIARLQPGQLVVRRFRFPDVGDKLNQHDIRVGVRQSVGPAVLNMILSAKDLSP